MSNLCHQIISEFLHTVITYEHELELLRRQLAENENFDIFYSFQSIDKFGNGVLDSNDIKAVYDVHGIKIKKEELEFLNKKGDTPLNITYKEFMNLLLSASSISLREKCLRKGGSKANPSQENDRVVEDKILELFNKKIEYAKALQVFSTYDVSPIDLRDSLFECCEESRGFLEHRKLEALMKKHNYTFDKSDFATIKRLASTFLETKISPAQFVAFMLPQADVISLTNHGVYPAGEHRHTHRSHTQETFRNNHMAQIQHETARKSSTPQPELRYSYLNVDLTSPTSNNRPSIFPSLEPEKAERAAFYAERPHLMEQLGVHVSPNFKGTRKTVKFSVDDDDRYNNFEESLNTRPSFGSGLQSINSNGRNQPELLIKDNPLSVNDLPSTDNRQTAGSHIFESHVKAAPHNKENAVRHVRESHHGRNSQKSPPRVSHETPYSAKSQQIKDQVILREANKIKSQYDDKLAGKRELLNLSKQKRADSSVVVTNQKSPNKGHKRGIVEGVSVVDSVYFDPNRTMNMSVRNVNYTMSSKYDNSHNRKKSVSPDQKYATFESGWKLTDYTGGGNKHGKMPSLEVARFNSQNDGLTELRNLANADENGQKVIDDAYLNRLHYILDRKNAERDAHALKAERTVSFQPAAQSPYFEPNYQQDRNGDYRDYTGRRDISGFIQEIGRNSPTRRDSPTRSNSKNFTQFRDSPKRDLRLNNEISVMSDINTLENLKIGSYRFGNNFYDRMLP